MGGQCLLVLRSLVEKLKRWVQRDGLLHEEVSYEREEESVCRKSSCHKHNLLQLFDVFSLFELVNLFTYFSIRVGVSLLLLHVD